MSKGKLGCINLTSTLSRITVNETSHRNNDRTSTTKQSSSFIQLLNNNTHCDPKQPRQTDDLLSSRLLHV